MPAKPSRTTRPAARTTRAKNAAVRAPRRTLTNANANVKGKSTDPSWTEPDAGARRRFRSRLLAWYRQHGRDLPWRRTDDPYHILVSEIMLQQTQVDRVLPKYHEWLSKYPSMHVLAEAPEAEVTKTWYPLGYNIRPRRLQSIAREAVTNHGGQLPSDEETLLSFKGIGQYTAGAIRSFAFRQRAAILDTNVARVLFRVFVGSGDPKAHAMKRHLWSLSEALVPKKEVFDFNQALMDFGAMLCSARQPKCLVCPMARDCRAFPWTPGTDAQGDARPGESGRSGESGGSGKAGAARSERSGKPGRAGKARGDGTSGEGTLL